MVLFPFCVVDPPLHVVVKSSREAKPLHGKKNHYVVVKLLIGGKKHYVGSKAVA